MRASFRTLSTDACGGWRERVFKHLFRIAASLLRMRQENQIRFGGRAPFRHGKHAVRLQLARQYAKREEPTADDGIGQSPRSRDLDLGVIRPAITPVRL